MELGSRVCVQHPKRPKLFYTTKEKRPLKGSQSLLVSTNFRRTKFAQLFKTSVLFQHHVVFVTFQGNNSLIGGSPVEAAEAGIPLHHPHIHPHPKMPMSPNTSRFYAFGRQGRRASRSFADLYALKVRLSAVLARSRLFCCRYQLLLQYLTR